MNTIRKIFSRTILLLFIVFRLRFVLPDNTSEPSTQLIKSVTERSAFRKFMISRREKTGIGIDKPRVGFSEPVYTNLSFTAMNFISLNQMSETVTIIADFKVAWHDEFWRWDNLLENNYTEFNISNIPYIMIDATTTWHPSLLHMNNAENIYAIMAAQSIPVMQMYLQPNGDVWWYPLSSALTAMCHLDFLNFPFDRQVCTYKFGFADACEDVLLGSIHFTVGKKGASFVSDNSEWELVGSETVKVTECADFVGGAEYRIFLRRRSLHFVLSGLMPLFFLVILQLSTYFLPIADVDRCCFSITCQLAIGVLQSVLDQQLPPSSKTSYISVLVAIHLTVSTLITLGACLSNFLWHYFVYRARSTTRKDDTTKREIRWRKVLHYTDIVLFTTFSLVVLVSSAIIFTKMQAG